jgi:hypothetical protein
MKSPKYSVQNQSILHHPVTHRPIVGDRIMINGGEYECGEWYDTGNEPMGERICEALNMRDELLALLQTALERLKCANLTRRKSKGEFMVSDIEAALAQHPNKTKPAAE